MCDVQYLPTYEQENDAKEFHKSAGKSQIH